jgi:excisionase family DNA binding protein
MEKICIVKRRKRDKKVGQDTNNSIEEVVLQDREKPEIPLHTETDNDIAKRKADPIFEEVTGQEEKSFSLELTPEQSGNVQSITSIQEILNESDFGVKLNLEQKEDGGVFFNFHFEPLYMARMLDSKGVCEMLQISKSLLFNLVKKKVIKSYKIGNLRRFSLEDVLEYLNKSKV